MCATKFEFEQRFWIFGAIFCIGFMLGALDHTNFAVALLHLFAPSLDPDTPRGRLWLRVIFGAGALLVFAAAFLRTWATAYLRTEIVHDSAQHSEAVLADGPFRYVRNPLYLANVPMAAGIGFLASPLGWLFLVLANWFFVYRLIFREERSLLAQQGESYRAYLRAVPRFWPSLSPKLPAGGAQARWPQAFAGECFVWLFGIAVLCLALTLDGRLTGIVFLSTFPIYFLAVYLAKRRASSRTA